MDFVRYAERAASLLNAPLTTVEDLGEFLADRAWLLDQIEEKDTRTLPRFQRELRPVFVTADTGDDTGVIDKINALLDKHPVTPYIAGRSDDTWHMHVSNKSSSVSQLLIAEALMGLAFLACDLGPQRLGVCQATGCDNAYVDTSPNKSRRYCSDRCSSRANVAAYRARQKAAPRAQAHA